MITFAKIIIFLAALLFTLAVFAAPEIITRAKVSAWGWDETGNLVPLQYVWNTNCGLWQVDVSTGVRYLDSTTMDQDINFIIDSSGTVVLR